MLSAGTLYIFLNNFQKFYLRFILLKRRKRVLFKWEQWAAVCKRLTPQLRVFYDMNRAEAFVFCLAWFNPFVFVAVLVSHFFGPFVAVLVSHFLDHFILHLEPSGASQCGGLPSSLSGSATPTWFAIFCTKIEFLANHP